MTFMRVVIVGAGMIGIHIARELIEEKRDVVIIEKNPEIARMVDNQLDCLVINDDGTRPETLRQAGTSTADWFIALTGSDSVNIVACGLVAAESNTTKTIARVETAFYSAFSPAQQKAFGLNYLVNPAMEVGRSLVQIIEEGFAEEVIPLHDGQLQLRAVSVSSSHDYVERTLAEIRQSSREHFLVAAVVRDNRIVVPRGDFKILATDRLYVLGEPASLRDVLGDVEGLSAAARRILVVGVSRISEQFIHAFRNRMEMASGSFLSSVRNIFKSKPEISVLEFSPDEAKRIAQVFPDIEVMQGDSSEEGVLESIGVERADLFIAATDSQSKNIITAQLSKALGAKKAIAITENDRFLPLGPKLDIDALVSQNDVVVSTVLALIRKGHIKTIHSFYEDDVEIVELAIDEASALAGKRLRDIVLPREVLVAFIAKEDGEIAVPSGDTVLTGGDVIGLVARKNCIAGLESAFEGK